MQPADPMGQLLALPPPPLEQAKAGIIARAIATRTE
jgi:hypothetical protein